MSEETDPRALAREALRLRDEALHEMDARGLRYFPLEYANFMGKHFLALAQAVLDLSEGIEAYRARIASTHFVHNCAEWLCDDGCPACAWERKQKEVQTDG